MAEKEKHARHRQSSTEADRLVGWFAAKARKLPWREPLRDPYRTLVSEIMLQQTQVNRVVPFFEGFIARFPNIEALAEAAEDEVLAQWSGLGYYRRARMLHDLALQVVRETGGELPCDVAGLKRLPGIGPYTAAAVASLVHGHAAPVMDGNVRRVAARRLALAGDLRSVAATRTVEKWVHSLMECAAPGSVNEALMELGARVCVPRMPACDQCPLADECVARRDGSTEMFPEPRRTRRPEVLRWVFACCVTDSGEWLLQKVEDGPILRGLWLPPFAVLHPGDRLLRSAAMLTDCAEGEGRECRPVRHTITYRRIEARPVRFQSSGRSVSAATWQFVRPEQLGGGTSSLLVKLVESVEK